MEQAEVAAFSAAPVRVLVSKNAGRDVGGYLRLLAAALREPGAVEGGGLLLFLHSKTDVGERGALSDCLFDAAATGWFVQPEVGMVCCAGEGLMTFIDGNLEEIAHRVGLSHLVGAPFCAGTMFFVRAEIFQTFFSARVDAAAEAEGMCAEGAACAYGPPHAWERLLSYIVWEGGYSIKGIAPSERS